MIALYWGCIAGGVLFAIVSGLLGDLLSHVFDGLLDFLSVDVLKPMTVATFVTGFGGAGMLLTEYTPLPSLLVVPASAVIALLLAAAVYFGYIKPMQQAENSTAFSMRELSGRIAEVTVPIPPRGYGEALVAPEMLRNVSGADLEQMIQGLTQKITKQPIVPAARKQIEAAETAAAQERSTGQTE